MRYGLLHSAKIFLLAVFIPCILPVTVSFLYAENPLINLSSPDNFKTLLPGDPKPLYDFESLVIPLKKAGNLYLIEAVIDGETGNLVFDTGASRLVLNKTYFRKYKTVNSGFAGGVTGAVPQVECIWIDKIAISSMRYEKIMADMADLGHIENRRGVKILGLFGFNMIKDFEVVIDFNTNELHLNRIDKSGERTDHNVSLCTFDITRKVALRNNILYTEGEIAGKSMHFCLDTGAETNILDSYMPEKVLNSVTITRRASLQGSGGRNAEVLYGVLGELSIGGHIFKDMQTIVSSLAGMSEAYGEHIDGMLGYDFFIQGLICINLAKSEMGICLKKGDKK